MEHKNPTLLLLAMQEELGELAARWLAEHPGYEKSMEDTDPIPEEVGDLIHLILAFCNVQNINFEECVKTTIKKKAKKEKRIIFPRKARPCLPAGRLANPATTTFPRVQFVDRTDHFLYISKLAIDAILICTIS